MVSTKVVTADELSAMGSDAPYDLIEGELHEVSPSWVKASIISQAISGWMTPFVREHSLGFITGEQGGYLLSQDPDTVVAPDLAFVQTHRIPIGYDFESFFPGPPDLAVEVVSPSDSQAEVFRKLARYAAANCPVVWIIYPAQRAVTVHELGEPPKTFQEGEVLTGGEILPGFELAVSEIFRLPLST
jgi:Uma2 family endonuclease